METNQNNMVVESIGIMFLFPCYDLHNPRLETYESCKHTFGNYRKVERYITVERFLNIKYINQQENLEMYGSGLKMHQSGNESVYQEAHGDFVK